MKNTKDESLQTSKHKTSKTTQSESENSQLTVERLDAFNYLIKGDEIKPNGTKRGVITEGDGYAMISTPKSEAQKVAPEDRTISLTKNGSIRFTPGKTKVVARISLVKGKDSPEAFMDALKELLGNDYINKVIAFQLDKETA